MSYSHARLFGKESKAENKQSQILSMISYLYSCKGSNLERRQWEVFPRLDGETAMQIINQPTMRRMLFIIYSSIFSILNIFFAYIDQGYIQHVNPSQVGPLPQLSAISRIRRQPPGPQWQCLQLHSCRPYIRHESDDSDYHAHNIGEIISVPTDHASSTPV